MAVVEFTEDKRNKLAKFVGFGHWICILPSFFCLLSALYIQILIEDKILFIENYNGAVLPGFLVFTGFFGLFAHILCGKVAFSNRLPEKREKWMAYLLPALVATVLIFLSEFISGIMCFVHIRELEESFDDGIKIAMAAYKNDATTKEEMDVLQMTFECCGSTSYTDWFSMMWIHPDFVNPIKVQSSHRGKTVNDDVPFSCCSPHVLRPCIHHHVHDNDLHFNYDYRTNSTLYTVGCTTKLMAFYEDSVLTVVGATVLSLSFIQLVLVIGLRFLQTSVQSAMSNSDQEGPSTGYLFTAPPTTTGLDTTVTSTEAETLLDTTADSTFSQVDDVVDEERYVPMDEPMYEVPMDEPMYEVPMNEPMYENVPPFEPEEVFQPENEAEHIYNEGEVEQYLASKFANSKEVFEPVSGPDYDFLGIPPSPPPLEPIYASINPSMTGSMNRSRPSLTKVKSDYGSYMAMNMSNSSWSPHFYRSPINTQKNNRKVHKGSHVRRHAMPSSALEGNSPKDTYVINMTRKLSPKLERSSSRQRQMNTESCRLLQPNFRDRSPVRMKSPYQIVSQQTRLSQKNLSQSVSPRTSPKRRASNLPVSPVMLPVWNRRSPKKGRSPKRHVSPQKTSFKTGVSYGCNHAYD